MGQPHLGQHDLNHSVWRVGMEHGGGTWDLEKFGLKDNGWHTEATFSCSAVNQHRESDGVLHRKDKASVGVQRPQR